MTDVLLHLEIRLYSAIKLFRLTDGGKKGFWHLLNHLFHFCYL